MGRDKAWLQVGGQPLIQRQLMLVRGLGAQEVFISGRAGVDYGDLNCRILRDSFPNAGPLAGIERALATATTPLLLVLAVDLPRMTAAVLHELLAAASVHCGVIPRLNGRIEPLVAIYPVAARASVVTQLAAGRNVAHEFAAHCVTAKLARLVDLPPDAAGEFLNWNEPNDLPEGHRANGRV